MSTPVISCGSKREPNLKHDAVLAEVGSTIGDRKMTLTSILDLGARREARERRIWLDELAAVQQLSFERLLAREAVEKVEKESAQLAAVG